MKLIDYLKQMGVQVPYKMMQDFRNGYYGRGHTDGYNQGQDSILSLEVPEPLKPLDNNCNHSNSTELDNRIWWCKDCGALRDNKYDWRHSNNFFMINLGRKPGLSMDEIDEVLYKISHNEYGDAQSKYDLSLHVDRQKVANAIHQAYEKRGIV